MPTPLAHRTMERDTWSATAGGASRDQSDHRQGTRAVGIDEEQLKPA